MNEELNLQEIAAQYAAERFEEARKFDVDEKGCNEAFKQAIEATKAYVDITKADDAHMEELEKLELERTKQEQERELKKRATRGDRIIKAVEVIGVVAVAPALTWIFNKDLARYVSKLEEFDVWKSSAGKSLNRIFKFGK